jgi:alpha-D-ribose 1-methylphosphonate 5-triphosphate synthase subunit PhnH
MSRLIEMANLAPGFEDPPLHSQRVFRAIMQAQARPGTIADLSATAPPKLGGLHRAAAALALTLCDQDTPVWLSAACDDQDTAHWLRFHCGSRKCDSPAQSAFAFADGATAPPLHALNAGDPRYPDRSTTLVLMCASLEGGPRLEISGPGIAAAKIITPDGLPDTLLQERTALHDRFPLGIDVFLVADTRLMAWPRTSRIAALEGR